MASSMGMYVLNTNNDRQRDDLDSRPRFMSRISNQAREQQTYRQAHQQSAETVPWRWPFYVLAVGCLLFYCVYLISYIMPTVISEYEATQNQYIFSGERSVKMLKKFTNLGIRIVGSNANEQLTPALLEEELKVIVRDAHPRQSIRYEIQQGDGVMSLRGATYAYQSIKNVIAVLDGSNGTHGVLVNCHYDSRDSSVGATDDAINCAVMLEMLRVLSKANIRLTHNVVFLFNGAEEVGLMAAHLFLKHEWAKLVDVFINLEGAGQGGRAILFQSGPKNGWLFQYYAQNAPYPYAQVLAEEIFQAGLIPSDTDFRIFRDYGNMPGLDIAFAHNGYVYHTIYDREEYVSASCHQYMGDNVLAVLRQLGNADELTRVVPNTGKSMVYFDYLGWFMVSYSYGAGVAINLVIFFLGILVFFVFFGRLVRWYWLPQSMGPLGRKIRNLQLYKKHRQFMRKFTKSKSNNEPTGNEDDNHKYYEYVPEMKLKDKVSSLERYQDATLGNQYMRGVVEDNFGASNDNVTYVNSTTELWSPPRQKVTLGAACKELLYATLSRILGMGLVFGVNALMALFVDGVAPLAMPFYSNIYVIFPIYWCPALAAYILPTMLYDIYREKRNPISLNMRCQMNLVVSYCLWVLVLFFMTCASLRSAYIVLVPVLFATAAFLIIHLTNLYKTTRAWIVFYLLTILPALFYQLYVVFTLYSLFIPIMGRSGYVNADMQMAMFSSIFILYITSFIIPLMTIIRKPWVVLTILISISFFVLAITLPTNLGHPYNKGPNHPAPQRYFITHTERKFYNQTSRLFRHDWGFYIPHSYSDRNNPRTLPAQLKEQMITLGEDCQQGMEMYCGSDNLRNDNWIPANVRPEFKEPVEIFLHAKTWTTNKCSFEFSFKGPTHITIEFTPRIGAVLDSWNLPDKMVATGDWEGRPTYSIILVRGTIVNDFFLKLNLNITGADEQTPLLDLSVYGYYVHHKEDYVPAFNRVIDQFPDFVTLTADLCYYESRVY